jgi:hypothetical protein
LIVWSLLMGLVWHICTSACLVPKPFTKSARWKVSATETSRCAYPDFAETNFELIFLVTCYLFSWLPERSTAVKKQSG